MHSQVTFRKQSGVVLFITLIALVILLLSAIALIRSTDTAQLISGNLAIKRDLTNEAETAIQAAVAQFAAGSLTTEASRENNLATANYSATVLASNAQGIPNVMFDPGFGGFSAVEPAAINGLTYRYLVDRMCPNLGASNLQHCVSGKSVAIAGGDAWNPLGNGGTGTPNPPGTVVYRVTVRVTDARQTESFIQTTLRGRGT